MMRGRRPRKYAAILFAAAAMMMIAISPAKAATGPDGFTILSAGSDAQAHVCNVFSLDPSYQAVVCADLATYEGASDYYVYARGEVYCQEEQAPHTEVACKIADGEVELATGDGSNTGPYTGGCAGTCPDARENIDTRTWDYSISAARNGVCSSNPNSSYAVWGLVLGEGITKIMTPDDVTSILGGEGTAPPNDGSNESTGHYYICP